MKSLNEIAYNDVIIGKSLTGLSADAKFYVIQLFKTLQLIDNKYKDWDKVTMSLHNVGKHINVSVYYDNKFIGNFDKHLMPDNINIIDELGWRYME